MEAKMVMPTVPPSALVEARMVPAVPLFCVLASSTYGIVRSRTSLHEVRWDRVCQDDDGNDGGNANTEADQACEDQGHGRTGRCHQGEKAAEQGDHEERSDEHDAVVVGLAKDIARGDDADNDQDVQRKLRFFVSS